VEARDSKVNGYYANTASWLKAEQVADETILGSTAGSMLALGVLSTIHYLLQQAIVSSPKLFPGFADGGHWESAGRVAKRTRSKNLFCLVARREHIARHYPR